MPADEKRGGVPVFLALTLGLSSIFYFLIAKSPDEGASAVSRSHPVTSASNPSQPSSTIAQSSSRFAVFVLRLFSFALPQKAFERFDKVNGVSNVTVHFHDHLDVAIHDPVPADEIRHAKADASVTSRLLVLPAHRATNPSRRIPAMICSR